MGEIGVKNKSLVGDALSFYIWGEPAAPLPGGRAACRPSTGRQVPAARRGAAGSRQGPPRKKIYVYLHVCPYRPAGAVGV